MNESMNEVRKKGRDGREGNHESNERMNKSMNEGRKRERDGREGNHE